MLKPLIYNSDVREIQKKMDERGSISFDEMCLLQQSSLSESQIQQKCRISFLQRFGGKAKFIQIDNGNSFLMPPGQDDEQKKMNKKYFARKMAVNKQRKAAEGTEKGMTDVLLIAKGKVKFVEFKKIGSPSEVDPTPEQKEIHQFLKDCEFAVHVTNNSVYFEKVICEEFAAS